ncbi:MAG: hypothetical protein PHP92_05000 [Candidatus Nanoarchaeia archaeon]|nr:hypothetical protein [Candidatus Nanoarchaeia archaeon]
MKLYDNVNSLRMYVHLYTPKIWKECICSVAFIPGWTEQQYAEFKLGNFPSNFKWYFKEAIISFFKELTKEKNMGEVNENN